MLKNMNKTTKNNMITYLMVIVVYAVIQVLVTSGSLSSLFTGLLVPICTYIILAISLNLVVGFLGELSLGHAGFMCIGAFTSAFFSKCMKGVIEPDLLRFMIALLLGAVCAGIFGILIGIPVLRLNGDYLAIVTLAFGEIIKNVINVFYIGKDSKGFHFSMKDSVSLNMEPDGKILLNGPQGISGTPKDSTFTIGFILILITLVIVLNLISSRTGRAIMATPQNFGYNMSIMILVFVVLGGIGSVRGSIIAAAILTLLPELLRGLSNYRMLIYAIVLIVMMLFNWAPKAIEWREKHLAKFKRKKAVKEEA